jgi:hypothetical protein
MTLAIGDEFEVCCDECGKTLRYGVGRTMFHLLGAPTPPVSVTPLDRRPGASFEGCPNGRDDCAGINAARARLHEVPAYAEWRRQPEVTEWFARFGQGAAQ